MSRHRSDRTAGDTFTGAPTFNSIAVLAFVGVVAAVVMIYSVGPGDRKVLPAAAPPRIPAIVGELPPPTPSPSVTDAVLDPTPASPSPSPSPSGTTAKPPTLVPPAAPIRRTTPTVRPAPVLVTAHYVTRTDWGDGFVADIFVQNVSASPVTWAVDLRYAYDVRITDGPWNAAVERYGPSFRFVSTSVLQPGQSVQFGFVAAKFRTSTSTPSGCAVNSRPCS